MPSNLNHWENIYTTKDPSQVSWTQDNPRTLELISRYSTPQQSLIDIGGGDSVLVDCLLELNYKDLTVLDVSSMALQKAQKRLQDQAKQVNWIHSSMLDINRESSYDVWHDRAAFHFLTKQEDIQEYISICGQVVQDVLILSTFSDHGPHKCSGLEISQYSGEQLSELFSEHFELVESFTEDHITPFNTKQNFQFTVFKRRV